jgi:hypothetical protein
MGFNSAFKGLRIAADLLLLLLYPFLPWTGKVFTFLPPSLLGC